jgi:transposase
MNSPFSPRLSASELARALLPTTRNLKIEHLEQEGQVILLALRLTGPTARCPDCDTAAKRVHSHYTRKIADLPWGSYLVRLHLRVRKFFCLFPLCARRIFAERLLSLVAPHARRTVRQGEILRLVGLAVGARAGNRLAKRLQMLVSPSTMLRLLHQTPLTVHSTPRVLGVDDFARRKGRTYGTILVDLEKRCPIDILPNRNAETLADWLRQHPGIEIITRDRSTEYTRGITEGAPGAIQVADRFHILCNLRDAMERVLDSNRGKLAGISLPLQPDQLNHLSDSRQNDSLYSLHQPEQGSCSELIAQQVRCQRRQHNYEEVRRLFEEGVNIKDIAKQLGICRMTVYRYLRLDVEPTYLQRRPMSSMIDPYIPYLAERWTGGWRNSGQLGRELREMGYPGSRRMVIVWAAQQRKRDGIPSPYGPKKYRVNGVNTEQTGQTMAQPLGKVIPSGQQRPGQQGSKPRPAPSSRRLAWFLIRDPQSLSMPEQAVLVQIREAAKQVGMAYHLMHEFHKIVKGRLPEKLDCWLKAAMESEVLAMQNFAAGIEKDKEAIVAAVNLEWSNGPVEGQVNRLKLRKRQLYGRAGFALLRQYVLNTP